MSLKWSAGGFLVVSWSLAPISWWSRFVVVPAIAIVLVVAVVVVVLVVLVVMVASVAVVLTACLAQFWATVLGCLGFELTLARN